MPVVVTCNLLCGEHAPKRSITCRVGTGEEWEYCGRAPRYDPARGDDCAPKPAETGARDGRSLEEPAPVDAPVAAQGARDELPCWDSDAAPAPEAESAVPCGWCGSCSPCGCGAYLDAMLGGEPGPAGDKEGQPQDEEESTDADTASDCSSEAKDSSDAAAVGALPKRADFSGRWVLTRIEGDFEALMADAGVAWSTRKLARSVNYGVGIAAQSIEQAGDSLSIEFQNGLANHLMKLNLSLGDQETVGEDGTPISVHPRWEGSALHIQGRRLADGHPMQVTRRYMDGPDMAVESTMSSGLVVTRFFRSA